GANGGARGLACARACPVAARAGSAGTDRARLLVCRHRAAEGGERAHRADAHQEPLWKAGRAVQERSGVRGHANGMAAAACAFLAIAAGAATTELTQARASITVDGATTVTQVVLPYHLDREQGTRAAQATFETHFPAAAAGADELYGLYVARIGNTAEIWLNDSLLAQLGDIRQSNAADYSKAPQYFSIPAQLLQPDNVIRIDLRGDGGRRGGLSTLVVGPEDEVRPLFERATRWRMDASLAVAVFSLMVGTLALVLWATQFEAGAGRAM